MATYVYTKSAVCLDRLFLELEASTITTAYDKTTTQVLGDQLTIGFKTDLSEGDIATLDALVSAHNGLPLAEPSTPVVIVAQKPFADPTYRTKRIKANVATCAANNQATIDFLLLEEMYVHGGEILILGAQPGDWFEAMIYDGYNGGIIPEAYRASLCEAWPVVASYTSEWVMASANENTFLRIDTRPLIAKVSQYLMLRAIYHAANVGSTRTIYANYCMLKALT